MKYFLREAKRYILANWLLIVIGCIITKKAVEIAYLERGYKAVGGEWFIIPGILVMAEIVRATIWGISEFAQKRKRR